MTEIHVIVTGPEEAYDNPRERDKVWDFTLPRPVVPTAA